MPFFCISTPTHGGGGPGPLQSGHGQRPPQIAQAPRLAGPSMPLLLPGVSPPVAVMPAGPRLGGRPPQGGVGASQPRGKADSKSPCENHRPAWVKHAPRGVHCPELLGLAKGGGTRVVLAGQSEGVASYRTPIVSMNFRHCCALIIRNLDTGETLVMHHDSGARSAWKAATVSHTGARPVSPATPTRGLIGRDRFGYAAFMAKPGRKRLLLVQSQRAYDRRDVVNQIAQRGAQVLQPLTLRTAGAGGPHDRAVWSMVYRPATDELAVVMVDQGEEKLMSFSNLVTGAQPVALPADGKGGAPAPDIVDGLDLYTKRIAQARKTGSADAQTILELCLTVAKLRNVHDGLTLDALAQLRKMPAIPAGLRQKLDEGSPVAQDRRLIAAITAVADHFLLEKPEPAPGEVAEKT